MLLWQGSLTDRLSEGNGPQNAPLFSRPRAFDLHISRKGAGKAEQSTANWLVKESQKRMGNVIFGMMVSLDGFVADRTGSVRRLYPEGSLGANTELEESIATTGAVVMGRRTYQMGEPDSYAESYEFQVPIFVLTHTVPKP